MSAHLAVELFKFFLPELLRAQAPPAAQRLERLLVTGLQPLRLGSLLKELSCRRSVLLQTVLAQAESD
jgi:hypothetical protein